MRVDNGLMAVGLTVGDFSRATHLSVKTLRQRGAGDTPEEAEWSTEIGWLIVRADARSA